MGRARRFNFSFSMPNDWAMADFVTHGTATSRSRWHLVDFRLKEEWFWSKNATCGLRGCWKAAAGSGAHGLTATPLARIDVKTIQATRVDLDKKISLE